MEFVMPINLHRGDIVAGKKGTYRITTSDSFDGGQSKGYFVEDAAGTKLFLKMFKEPTSRNPCASEFVIRQKALMKKLGEIPDFVCRDVEFFESKGVFYKVSERMNGISLQTRLDEAAANSDSEFWSQSERQISASVLAFTIAEIHHHGIAHLDLKPDNCYLAQRRIHSTGDLRLVIRLLDFDGAIIEGAPVPDGILGTPNYWSPEHIKPDVFGRPGKHSDVFTLGIMLYQVLARRYPFVSRGGFLSRAADPPRKFAPWISQPVADIIWRAIDPQPSGRPAAREIHEVLIRREVPEPPTPEPSKTSDRVVLIAKGRRVRFWKDAVLGRDSVRGISGYEYVDRYQARIFHNATGWVISPFEKTKNPTRLNGVALEATKRYPLREGDVIQVGRLSVTVEFEAAK
jgi:serine/threonine protein kinase